MKKINIEEKFQLFSDYWKPRIVAESNGQHVRITKLKGAYVWHSHTDEDELFLVVKGRLIVRFRDGEEEVSAGELLVIPRGVEHMPVAQEEVHLINITMAETKTTGETTSAVTVPLSELERI